MNTPMPGPQLESIWENILVYGIPILLFVVGFIWACWRAYSESFLFKYDEHNPFRRWCKKCGAKQEMYSCHYFGSHNNWWEEAGMKEPAISCKCKKYTDYH